MKSPICPQLLSGFIFRCRPGVRLTKHVVRVIVLAVLLLGRSAFAQGTTHDIQFVENSSTSLSATYDGSAVSVLNTVLDRWTITFPSEVLFSNFTFNSGWAEPASSLTNILDSPGSNQLFIL